jgi:DNA-binding MarR family transcriptional regulator
VEPEKEPRDAVARIVEQWGAERPELDATPMLIVGRIARLNHLLDDRLRFTFAAVSLANGDFDVLAALRRTGAPYECRPVELSRSLMVTSGGITKRLDRLEGQGLVTREDATYDGRGKLVRLTGPGLDLVDRLITQHLANERRLLAGLSEHDREQLARLLGRLALTLERVPGG